MSVAVVHFTANQNDGTASLLDTTITSTTGGNGGVLAIFWKGATTISSVVEGTAGASFGENTTKLDRPTDGHLQIFGKASLTGGLTNIRVNFSGSSSAIEAYWWEVSGQSTVTILDTANTGTGTATSGTSVTTSSFTPSGSGLIISLACADPTGTASGDTGYTVEYNPLNQGIVAQDKSFTSGAQTTTATYGNAMTKGAIISVTALAAATSSGVDTQQGPFQIHGSGGGPLTIKRLRVQRYPDPTGFPPLPPDNTRVWQPFKEAKGPGRRGPAGRMAPQQYPDNFIKTLSTTYISAWSWKGVASSLTTIIAEAVGKWTWSAVTSPLSTEIVSNIGKWTWAATTSTLSVEVVASIGKWTWSGTSSSFSTIISEKIGSYTWAGITATLNSVAVVNQTVGTYTWSGNQSTLSSILSQIKGQWSWSGIHSTISTGGSGSTVIFFDGVNVADGVTYHKDVSRPHIVLTPVGDGTFTVVKDSSVTDMKSQTVNKETYLIDGNLP